MNFKRMKIGRKFWFEYRGEIVSCEKIGDIMARIRDGSWPGRRIRVMNHRKVFFLRKHAFSDALERLLRKTYRSGKRFPYLKSLQENAAMLHLYNQYRKVVELDRFGFSVRQICQSVCLGRRVVLRYLDIQVECPAPHTDEGR